MKRMEKVKKREKSEKREKVKKKEKRKKGKKRKKREKGKKGKKRRKRRKGEKEKCVMSLTLRPYPKSLHKVSVQRMNIKTWPLQMASL